MAAILSALAFALRHWKWALIATLVAAIGGLVFLDSVHLRERDNARADTAAEQAAHKQTAANFRLATAEATRSPPPLAVHGTRPGTDRPDPARCRLRRFRG